ncbi:hypothetical protein EGM85_12195, partial [Macrococcus caseolyticus]
LFSMAIANLMDVMFCSWLIFACEQLQHLKAIMKHLIELSASLDTYRPNTAELFRASSTEKSEKIPDTVDMDIRGIYSTQQDFGMTLRGAGGRLQNFGQQNPNPNGLTPKQEMLARSAIKYWVERHKHVVRLVASIGDTYGTARCCSTCWYLPSLSPCWPTKPLRSTESTCMLSVRSDT